MYDTAGKGEKLDFLAPLVLHDQQEQRTYCQRTAAANETVALVLEIKRRSSCIDTSLIELEAQI